MDTTKLAQVLKQTASLFAASGTVGQSKAIASVADALAAVPAMPVDAFVKQAAAGLRSDNLNELSAKEIVDLLDETRGQRAAALALVNRILSANLDKAKLVDVAALFTGGKPLKTKPQAQQAIKAAVERRLYLESKEAQNEKVTPW
jgi:hypothetical protein